MPVRRESRTPKTQRRVPLRTRTAYHEAGHAVLSAAINDFPHHVTIRRHGDVLGGAKYRMAGRPELLVQVHLAGFAAEEILMGSRSRDTANRIGLACLSAEHGLKEGREGNDEHRAVRELLKMEVEGHQLRQEVERFLEIALESLVSVWPSVEAVAKALLKHEELDGLAVGRVIRGDFYTPVIEVQANHGLMLRDRTEARKDTPP